MLELVSLTRYELISVFSRGGIVLEFFVVVGAAVFLLSRVKSNNTLFLFLRTFYTCDATICAWALYFLYSLTGVPPVIIALLFFVRVSLITSLSRAGSSS